MGIGLRRCKHGVTLNPPAREGEGGIQGRPTPSLHDLVTGDNDCVVPESFATLKGCTTPPLCAAALLSSSPSLCGEELSVPAELTCLGGSRMLRDGERRRHGARVVVVSTAELGIYTFTSIARWRNDDGVGCSVGGEEIGY
jgi:hypothetical protein